MLGITQKAVQQNRLAICMQCPSMKIIPLVTIAKCNDCGCPIRSKIALEVSKCPQGKW